MPLPLRHMFRGLRVKEEEEEEEEEEERYCSGVIKRRRKELTSHSMADRVERETHFTQRCTDDFDMSSSPSSQKTSIVPIIHIDL